MKPFRLNKHGKLVFPSSIFVDLDFSIIADLDQLQAIIRRDFEVKAPTGTEIAERAAAGSYATRYDLLRDLGLHLFWANRFALPLGRPPGKVRQRSQSLRKTAGQMGSDG